MIFKIYLFIYLFIYIKSRKITVMFAFIINKHLYLKWQHGYDIFR